MEEVGFEVEKKKKQERSSKALGRFERELILTGVKCQSSGRPGWRKIHWHEDTEDQDKTQEASGLYSSYRKTGRNKTIWGQ